MKLNEAACKLATMYDEAKAGEKALSVHLFGIRYAGELEGLCLHDVVSEAKLPKSYATEIRKGMKLADHVMVREG